MTNSQTQALVMPESLASRFLQFLFTVSCVQVSWHATSLRHKTRWYEYGCGSKIPIVVVAYSVRLLPHAPTDAVHSIRWVPCPVKRAVKSLTATLSTTLAFLLCAFLALQQKPVLQTHDIRGGMMNAWTHRLNHHLMHASSK